MTAPHFRNILLILYWDFECVSIFRIYLHAIFSDISSKNIPCLLFSFHKANPPFQLYYIYLYMHIFVELFEGICYTIFVIFLVDGLSFAKFKEFQGCRLELFFMKMDTHIQQYYTIKFYLCLLYIVFSIHIIQYIVSIFHQSA